MTFGFDLSKRVRGREVEDCIETSDPEGERGLDLESSLLEGPGTESDVVDILELIEADRALNLGRWSLSNVAYIKKISQRDYKHTQAQTHSC
jgi:hypothetical protein